MPRAQCLRNYNFVKLWSSETCTAQHSTAQHSTAQHSTAQQIAEYQDYFRQRLVNQIDPALDIAWQPRLRQIFAFMQKAWPEKTIHEFLNRKRIYFDRTKGGFFHKPDPIDLQAFIERQCPQKLKALANFCLHGVEQLRQTDDVLHMADLLENILEKINSLNLETEHGLLIHRRALHEKFIHAAAAVIKSKNSLKIPPNQRNLSAGAIKCFINEVFLKQQLLDFWFHVLRKRQLARMEHPLLNSWLSHEQGMRKLEVVHTTQYVFALASSHEQDVNLFSIRRFLHEERIRDYTYLNGAFIKNDQFDDPINQRAFKAQVKCIVSIEGRIQKTIIDALERMEEHYDGHIRPYLFQPLDARNASLGQAIERKLKNYAQELQFSILAPFKKCLTQLAVHEDDFNYLFITVQQLLREAAADFRELQTHAAWIGNLSAERMMMRLLAYGRLLARRHEKIFNLQAQEQWQKNHNEAKLPLETISAELNKCELKAETLKEKISAIQNSLSHDTGVLGSIPLVKSWRRKKLDAALHEMQQLLRLAYMDIMKTLAPHKSNILNMEHDSMLFLTEQRTFALCAGSNGIDALPSLLVLPEKYREFDPVACRKILNA